jgi:ABC-2 type transport system ATP-binding protein
VLSSHLVADIERVCDYLIVLTSSRVQVAGDIDDLLASHHRLIGPRREMTRMGADQHVIAARHTERQSTLLVRSDGPIVDTSWTIEAASLEDLVLAYMALGKAVELNVWTNNEDKS